MPGALDADFCMDFNMSSLQRGKDKATKRLQFQCLKARSLRSKRHPSFDVLIFGVQIQSATTCSMLFRFVGFSVLTLMFSCPFGHSDLVQELWRCFNEWLQHLRSKKISLKPSLSLNDPVVVHATCVPRNKERCQFCLTAWPKQLIHIAHTNMFVYKAYLWDTTCRLSSKRFWTDRVNFNISQNGFLLAAITRRAAWPPRISQARQWKLRAKLEGLHETKRRKAKSEIAIIQITNWVGTRDDTALVVSDVDVEVVEVILRKSYRFHCVPTWSTRQLEERISLGQRICGHHTERLNDWRPKNSVLTLWHLAPETSELPPLVHSRDEAFLDNFF